jgi:tyrosinase
MSQMGYIFLVVLFLLISTAVSEEIQHANYKYSMDRNPLSKRQSSSFNPIVTGAQGGIGPHGSAPLRREVRDLETDSTTWTLYILGLDMMQYTDQNDIYSWYQIAGEFAVFPRHSLHIS